MKAKIGDVFVGKEEALKIQDITVYGYLIALYHFKNQQCVRYVQYHCFASPPNGLKDFRLATKMETAKYTLLAGW